MTTGTDQTGNSLPRWKAVCAYDGSRFNGWQSQPNGKTVQDRIETALANIFHRPIRIHGTSRTDTGVHARGMVFHFDAVWKTRPEHLVAALRRQLPSSISVTPITPAPPGFHARFSATSKIYRYFIFEGFADPFVTNFFWSHPRPLDTAAMAQAAEILKGEHDFSSFAAFPGREIESPVRNLKELSVERNGPEIIITAEADGFLYKMVRSLVGALVAVGIGKIPVPKIKSILEERERTSLIITAPPQGLFLEKVTYPDDPTEPVSLQNHPRKKDLD